MNKYKLQHLSNKIPLVMIPVKGAATVTVLVMVKTGSKYESREQSGLSHFLEHLFFKGTKKRSTTLAISSALDILGGEYNAFTSKEYTGYWVKVAAPKLGRAMDIVSDMLLNSQFDEEEIAREKGVIIEELNMYEDNPLMHIEDVFESCLYGDSPAGWDTIGTKENIQRFKRQDFIDYLNQQYGTKSMHIILAGGVKDSDKKIVEKLFSGFQKNPWKRSAPTPDKQKNPQTKGVYKKIDQTNLSLGVRTFPACHAEEFRVKLLAVILGGSMSSRLFINLRERNGLAYYVRTSAETYSDAGYLTTQAGVPREKAAEAIKIIMSEYQRIKEELIDEKEIKRAKEMLIGKSLLQLEATDNLANWYGRQAMMRSKMMTPKEYLNQMKQITASQLRQTARKIFVADGLNLALIGQDKAEKYKSILKL